MGPDLEEPKKLCFFTVDFSTGQQQAATKAGGAGNAAKCDVTHCYKRCKMFKKKCCFDRILNIRKVDIIEKFQIRYVVRTGATCAMVPVKSCLY